MKSTGIVRKIDELGRVVLPVEIRKSLNIAERDPVEIYTEGDKIILKKHDDSCLFCGATEDLLQYKEKSICKNCVKAIVSAR